MEVVTFFLIHYVMSLWDSNHIAKVVERPVSQQISRLHGKSTIGHFRQAVENTELEKTTLTSLFTVLLCDEDKVRNLKLFLPWFHCIFFLLSLII